MTGEISLQGKVLPVGSLKEKSLAAIRASLKEVVVPKLNDRELQELAAEFTRHLTFVPVTHLDEVLEYVVMS